MRDPKPLQAVLFILTLAAAVPAQTGAGKKAWEWSPEERVAARFAPRAVAARIEAVRGDAAVTDHVSGASHPELLLPTEIVTTFTRSAYAQAEDDVARAFRAEAARKAVELGLPQDFMSAFEAEMRAFIALQAEEEALRRSLSQGTADVATTTAKIRRLQSEQCPLRAAAMAALRQQFGVSFDRFLYLALAPNIVQTTFNPKRTAASLLRQEGGCG